MAVEQVGKCSFLLESLLTDLNAFSNPQDFLAFKKEIGFANGTGANQADRRWSSPGRSLGTTAGEDLDLAGSLLDYRGNAITFARVRGIAVFNNATMGATTLIRVGNASTQGFVTWVLASNDAVDIRPQGLFVLMAPDATGYVVTAGTGDRLRVANTAAGTVTYDIAIIGSSA